MFKVNYANRTRKDFKRIDRKAAIKILKKIQEFSIDPLKNAEPVKNPNLPKYRFRIGDYRVLFDIDTKNKIIFILKIAHRKEIYC